MSEDRTALLESRAIVRVAGPEAHLFLHGLVTQDVTGLESGAAAFSALLTPQGKILFDFFLIARDEGYLIDCDKAVAPALLKQLDVYKLRAQVTFETCEDWIAAAVFDRECEISTDGVIVFDDPRLAALGRRVVGPRAAVATALSAFGPAGEEAAYHRRRIGLGVPEAVNDFDSAAVFLLDVNYDALKGVSYAKGCFVGQEVTSRMKRKGDIRKRTLLARFDGPAPEKGTPVMAGENTLGETLSAVPGAALTLVRLDRLAAAEERGARPAIGGRAAQLMVPDWLERA
ncbi:MAG: YgfZ/GcvT domain-containing protein [Parvularculaceae bacterium]